MILGVVGDTHNHLSNVEKIIDIFNERKVDKVIHTGDITQAKTLSRFFRLNCQMIGVYGNNDLEEEGLKDFAKQNGFNFQDPPFLLRINNTKIAMDFVIGCKVVSGIVNVALDEANMVADSDSGRPSMPFQSETSSSLMRFPARCST